MNESVYIDAQLGVECTGKSSQLQMEKSYWFVSTYVGRNRVCIMYINVQ
jgi:hypothetical protein